MRYVLTIRGSWNQLKNKLRNKYVGLSAADCEYIGDQQEAMMDALQMKLGKTRQEFIRILNAL
jgi:hypothetical protein